MNLTRRDFLKTLGIGSVGTAAMLALAACGGNGGSTGTNTGSTGSTGTTGTTGTVGKTADDNSGTNITVNEGGEEADYVELIVGVANMWDTPTTWRSNIANDSYCGRLIFESLGQQDADCNWVPWAAKGWTTNDKGFTYDFELYDYMKDQEGTPITADDIVWFVNTSIEKAQKPNWRNIESITATGEHSFQVKLTQNQVGVIENFVFDTFPVSRAAVEASGDDFATTCVSTSAYKLVSFTSGVEMVFEKNPDYWQTDLSLLQNDVVPRVDKVTLKLFSEASQMGNALEAGDIQFAMGLGASVAILYEGNPDFSMQEYTMPNGIQLFFSGAENMPCGTDENLRKAIAYCINPDLIISSVYQGYAGYMYDTANEKAQGYLQKWKEEEYYPYDVEKAKECLAASNYEGQTLIILCGGGFKSTAEILISAMDAIGVKSEILTGDMAWVQANRLDGTIYDMFINQVGCVSLAAQWSIRFDPNGYATGDGTSRHDYELGELLYKTWTQDGYTEENIDAVHTYIKEHMYAYGMVDNHVLNVWNNNVNMIECVNDYSGCVRVQACRFGK